ncbi:LysR family transcriptional regulator [Neorhizobium tomejilense]|uniref:LysR family transcriptional regulator n=1 Tax=Neorhizobium tomejilense TaxID=2093828 RepID=UPI003ECD2213
MTIPRFTLRQLGYFLAVAEQRTISAAADRLNISQGALTEAIGELENQLSVQLFVRRRAHGVVLTVEGRDLLAYARATLSSAEDLQTAVKDRQVGLSGRMVIGCYMTLAPFLLPRLVSAFQSQHPSAVLDLFQDSGEAIAERLHLGECDLAILYDYSTTPDMICDELYWVQPRVVLPADHKLADKDEVELKDLEDETNVLFDVEPALSNTQQILRQLGTTAKYQMRARSIELVRAMVGHGLGYAILLHHPPTHLSYEGKPLVVKPIARLNVRYKVMMARSRNLRSSRRGDRLRDFCLSVLRQTRPSG